MIETTETKEVENKLKEYKNLKMVSHGRGIQYVNISNEYIYVLDRFHLPRNKKSMYDKGFDLIKNLFNDEYSVKSIYSKIHDNDNNYKLNSLRHYVRNRFGIESVKKED